jgi:hypothetical protein
MGSSLCEDCGTRQLDVAVQIDRNLEHGIGVQAFHKDCHQITNAVMCPDLAFEKKKTRSM